VRQLAGLFPATAYPNVLVGLGEPDDAAVVQLDETRALIATTDFFTPVVDDPWTYGAIAAANAMSDVYAMGGEVLFCLNLAGFPEAIPAETIAQIFAGGAVKVREAGAAITGGHTITSPEPFYGLSVTGLIDPTRVMRKGGARPGDRLFLTKPLGTGVITTAAKLTGPGEGRAHRLARRAQGKPDLDMRHLDAAILSMSKLNRDAARAGQAAQVRSATDITGFGLLGHAAEMAAAAAREAALRFRIHADAVPTLPGVWTYTHAGYLTRGHARNPAAFADQVRIADSVSPAHRILLWEAETSGGLLLAVPADSVDTFTASCAAVKQDYWAIGEVLHDAAAQAASGPGVIEVV
jgi:selenide,water dikinase